MPPDKVVVVFGHVTGRTGAACNAAYARMRQNAEAVVASWGARIAREYYDSSLGDGTRDAARLAARAGLLTLVVSPDGRLTIIPPGGRLGPTVVL
jgi:hypothetical protein